MELNYFKDKLFDLLNDSEGMGIADLDAEDRNNLLTVRTEAYLNLCAGKPQTRRSLVMAYEVWKFKCSDRKRGKLEYRRDENYVCPLCGKTYHDDELELQLQGIIGL